ncbi:MAG: MmgE/PrpD family protein [Deltaproteobacteria bacterium]|nr:MmgE/PrpD family protein [Deltaproteobacteria bacterium]
MNVSMKLAEFITGINYSDFKSDIIEKSKEAVLDWLGVTIAGTREEAGLLINNYVITQCSKGNVSIIGTPIKTSVSDAALAMGTLSHALDFDDISWPMIGHPSVTILPAIFALCEEKELPGWKGLEAFVTGFEVESLLGEATSEYHYHHGWHTTGTLGPLGSAAACSKILELDAQKICNALGIAASHASGLRQNFGTMTKPLHAGNAARGGLVAALLAKSGFTADESIFDAALGFPNVFCGKDNHKIFELDQKLNLNKPWSLLNPGQTLKKYPSCGLTSAAIDCMIDLCHEQNIIASEIKEIECAVAHEVTNVLIRNRPQSGLEGKFSMEYCLAVAALDNIVGLKQFTDHRVAADDVQDLLRRVTIVTDDSLHMGESRVRITTDRGVYEKASLHAIGTPENPMTYDEIKDKFRMCSEDILNNDVISQIIDSVTILDDIKNLKYFVSLTCPM